jgi:hypothetical protein
MLRHSFIPEPGAQLVGQHAASNGLPGQRADDAVHPKRRHRAANAVLERPHGHRFEGASGDWYGFRRASREVASARRQQGDAVAVLTIAEGRGRAESSRRWPSRLPGVQVDIPGDGRCEVDLLPGLDAVAEGSVGRAETGMSPRFFLP